MFFYFFWILWLFLTSLFKTKRDVSGIFVYRSRVGWSDIDFFGHVNNASYLSILERARWDLSFSTDIGSFAVKKRWFPVLVGANLRYKRQLKLFQAFRVETQVFAHDSHAFYFVQNIYDAKDRLVTAAVLKVYVQKGGLSTREYVYPAELIQAGGSDIGNHVHPDAEKLFGISHELEGMMLEDAQTPNTGKNR